MINHVTAVFKKFAVFTGRSSRAEYWYFFLFNFLVGFVLGFIGGLLKLEAISMLINLYQLVVLIPSIACGIRRMHDVDKSGWYILIPIYNLVLALTPGTKGNNKFGAEPHEVKAS